MPGFRTLDQADLKGKRVLVRVDLNVPVENGKVTDATRIERAVPTIKAITDKGGKVILLSHFGRPKGRDPKESLKPVAQDVSRVIGKPVAFADDCIGEAAEKAVAAMKPGDVLCLVEVTIDTDGVVRLGATEMVSGERLALEQVFHAGLSRAEVARLARALEAAA